jgi:addiction module HigA family antidote
LGKLPIIHPGEILREEFLEPLGMIPARLAAELGVSRQAIGEILRERRGISADMALRLGRYFRTTPQFWLSLQTTYELRKAREALGGRLEAIREREPVSA